MYGKVMLPGHKLGLRSRHTERPSTCVYIGVVDGMWTPYGEEIGFIAVCFLERRRLL